MKHASRVWMCEACTVTFQVHTPLSKRPYCPNCGDDVEVRRYKAQRSDPVPTKIKWSDAEIQLLDRCITKELLPYQVALLTGRTPNSVTKRLERRRKQNEQSGAQITGT